MKSDTVLIVVLVVLGYVLFKRMGNTLALAPTTGNPVGGQLPAGGAMDPVAAIANAAASVIQTIGSFAQAAPKTT